MISELVKKHIPEWVEAGSILLTLILGAVVSAGITFYKVDTMSDDVKDIKATMLLVPVLVNRVNAIEQDITKIEKDVDVLEQRIYDMKGVTNAKEGGA